MRAGAYTIHQSLTAEAAAVLKLALGLTRRRGHAQVTPLHVAFALLATGPSPPPFSSSAHAYGLLKRACLRSHPLQCRALELCFNGALNRLPTTASSASGPSSFASSLIQPSPTLSNALVAALKRAQASQRRGCVELNHHPPPPPSQQQQPPLLAIKVELDQLVISILDDPSVSRVMREAGFSSAAVKTNLEEEDAALTLTPPASTTSPPPQPSPPPLDSDVRAVLDVMLQQRNPVVVGDSASTAESVADELQRRLDDALSGVHVLRLRLSYVHARLMTRADADARAAELRRGADAVRLRPRRGLVVFVGDLSWALQEDQSAEPPAAYSAVEHMVAELARLLDDLRGRAWIVATASYQTYMRWKERRRGDAWALQAVLVPTGTGTGTGLALNSLNHHPSASAAAPVTLQQSPFALGQQQAEKLLLCADCSNNYEREASMVKAETDAEGPRAGLPSWLVPDRPPPPPDEQQHKDKYLVELKQKWSRLCTKLHLCAEPPFSPPCPWWPPSRSTMAGLLGLDGLTTAHGKSSTRMASEWTPLPGRWGLREPGCQDDVGTALALGSLPLSDTASSGGGGDGSAARELELRLRRNIPWQPAAVAAQIADAVAGGNEEEKGVWLCVKGSDHAAVRRAAAVISEARCGGAPGHVVCADTTKFTLLADVVARARSGGRSKRLVLVFGNAERAPAEVVDCLVAASRSGALKDGSSGRELDLSSAVVILATAKLTTTTSSGDEVIGLRLWSEDEEEAPCKRKPDAEPPAVPECKRPRHEDDVVGRGGLDLNIDLCAGTDSDITHEEGSGLLESVAARAVVTLDDEGPIHGHLHSRLARALRGEQYEEMAVRVDDEAVELLAAASGHFLEETLERWIAEVLEPAVRNGGKGNVLVLDAGSVAHRQPTGFMGSVLPSRVHVD